ncbi:hypothetical protein KOAAANKH_03067 [Brevundimonas sp. NIBR10]|uniref:Tat pathway signal sequence domain protein n=1 Tax=Brevundimonas sp. NIBR10 TaxID=3015997 RepID=UPI0022F199A5|nr:Tat pathway signal sequence domain protein [Brevundimonas sp. NIBR10]WGM48171.1 hypothetical protein KOAAANKH_03067 [Brevundimonas sp. NIBR10]
MRRVISVQTAALAAVALFAGSVPVAAHAQSMPGQQQQGQRDRQQGQEEEGASRRPARIAPLNQRANAGPCPYVKILYDAARYVELADNRPAVANVGYTGEIEGVTAGCSYRGDEPITVQMDLLFNLGRGAQATADQRTYRYWIAVTARNEAVLAKEYFDLPVDFEGARTASVTQEKTIVIPRANAETSGSNFEVLVGFDVTPEMAAFNRDGSRFRVNAGTAPVAQPPAQ